MVYCHPCSTNDTCSTVRSSFALVRAPTGTGTVEYLIFFFSRSGASLHFCHTFVFFTFTRQLYFCSAGSGTTHAFTDTVMANQKRKTRANIWFCLSVDSFPFSLPVTSRGRVVEKGHNRQWTDAIRVSLPEEEEKEEYERQQTTDNRQRDNNCRTQNAETITAKAVMGAGGGGKQLDYASNVLSLDQRELHNVRIVGSDVASHTLPTFLIRFLTQCVWMRVCGRHTLFFSRPFSLPSLFYLQLHSNTIVHRPTEFFPWCVGPHSPRSS